MKLVNDPQISPDGSQVVFTVTELDEKENRYRSALWLVGISGDDESRRLTSGMHRDGQPRWSPDGRHIAFTSDRNDDDGGKGQLWLLPVSGGEAARLTCRAEPIEEYAWSPDSRWIACVSKVQYRHPDDDPDSDVKVIRTVRFRYDGEGYLEDKYRQIFVIDAHNGDARQITEGQFEHQHPAWSPSGHEIAFSSNRDEGWEFSRVRDIHAVRPNGNAIRRITDGTGAWSHPSWSPDATQIACFGARRLESDSARAEIFIVPAGGGSPVSLTSDFDRNMRDGTTADVVSYVTRPPLWDAEGRTVSAVFSDQGSVQMARVSAPDGELQALTSGRHRIAAPAVVPGGGYVVAMTDMTQPGELYAMDAEGRSIRQLTHFNDDWLATTERSDAEPFWVESADGTPIHGWIMKPIGFEPGTTYPMLLEIHGGPFGMYGESMMHEFQLLAVHGYVVLFTNPRGSTGYGDEFAGQLYRAWGKNDFPDLMAAVDWAIEQGYVDENRLGVLGGSYGGFMTNWVITHTTRFKAAITQRTVSNMYSTFGADDIFYASSKQTIGADPWDDPDIYWELSPISYVDRIETPLLIEVQEEDWRCPPEQSEQLFTALKQQGKVAEMVRYPDESHGMSRTGQPRHRVERLRHILDWFDRHV